MNVPCVLLVEDDLIIAAHLNSVIKEAGYAVIETLTRGESVMDFLSHNKVDVILMDVQLAGKQDGIETAELIYKAYDTPLIFLTANVDQKTFERAKGVFPYAFISKPFKQEDLLRTLELVFNQKDFDSEPQTFHSKPKILADRIFVRDKNKMVRLKIEEILYVEAERNYCKITTKDKPYTLSIPLLKFLEKVSSDTFVRIHRSHLVNINTISELNENYVFINGKSLAVSKSYKQALTNKLTLL